ncbi:MAG: hypothetical protein WCB53_13970 [Terriglobales bacterium]
MLILLQDAQGIPGVFHPFGAIPEAELRAWLRQTAVVLPSDLIGLWEMTGGGDIFDTETVFRQTVLRFQTPVSHRMTLRAETPRMLQKESLPDSTYFKKELFSPLFDYLTRNL